MVRFAVVVALAGFLSASVMAPVVRAQQSSGITGIVKDTSGAVLPGVTIEAASSSLIEKVAQRGERRPGTIQHRRPGAGNLRGHLHADRVQHHQARRHHPDLGFHRAGERRFAGRIARRNHHGQRRVAARRYVERAPPGHRVGRTALDAAGQHQEHPVARDPDARAGRALVDVGGRYLVEPGAFHGKRGTKVSFDGLVVENSDGNSSYQINAAAVSEMAAQTSGLSAEVNADGPVMNMIPKEGGNSFNTIAAGLFSNYNLEGSNLNDELRSRGFTSVNQTYRLYDAVGEHRRADQEERALVLHRAAHLGRVEADCRRLLEPDAGCVPDAARRRTQSREVDAVGRSPARRDQRTLRVVQLRLRPRHVAGLRAQQVQPAVRLPARL